MSTPATAIPKSPKFTVLILGGQHSSIGKPYVILQQLKRLHDAGIPMVIVTEYPCDFTSNRIYENIKRVVDINDDFIKLEEIFLKNGGYFPADVLAKFFKDEAKLPNILKEKWDTVSRSILTLAKQAKQKLACKKAQFLLYHFIKEKNIPFFGIDFENKRMLQRAQDFDTLGSKGFLKWEPALIKHMTSELQKALTILGETRGLLIVEDIGLYHAHRLAGAFTQHLLSLKIPKENFTVLPIECSPASVEIFSSYVTENERLDIKEYSEGNVRKHYENHDSAELKKYYESHPMLTWNWSARSIETPNLEGNFYCPKFSAFTIGIVNQNGQEVKKLLSEFLPSFLPRDRISNTVLSYFLKACN